jgi:hypothetical protein
MSTSGKKAIRKSERQRKRNEPQQQDTVHRLYGGKMAERRKKEWINTQGSGLAAIFFCTPSEKI